MEKRTTVGDREYAMQTLLEVIAKHKGEDTSKTQLAIEASPTQATRTVARRYSMMTELARRGLVTQTQVGGHVRVDITPAGEAELDRLWMR